MRDIPNGILLGLGLGIGLAFFLEYLDNTLRTPDDVKRHLGVPLLGVVPEVVDKKAGRVVGVTTGVPGPFSEGYRIVRTALRYSWPDRAPRVLIVTSTAPGEGKTLTSVNLAATLAALDGNVLLIDCDLRKPTAHTILKARKSPGLSDILVGKCEPLEAIQHIKAANLSFLPSGAHAPSPADLMTDEGDARLPGEPEGALQLDRDRHAAHGRRGRRPEPGLVCRRRRGRGRRGDGPAEGRAHTRWSASPRSVPAPSGSS